MTRHIIKFAFIICTFAIAGQAQTPPVKEPKPLPPPEKKLMGKPDAEKEKRDRIAKPDDKKPGDPATAQPGSMPPSAEGMGVSAAGIKVPKGKAIKADGTPDQGEWDDAVMQEMSGGGQLFLKHDGKSLYIGVIGPASGAAQILLAMGDSVYVLRSADALGTAVYKKDKDGMYQPSVKFDKGTSDAKYMAANSWMASVDPDKSAKAREYVIGGKFKSGTMKIAVVQLGDPAAPAVYPKSLADDSLKSELLSGDTPAGLKFAEADWAALELSE